MISGLPRAQLCTLFALLIGFNGSCLYLFCFALQSRPARRFQTRIGKAAGLLVSGLTRAKLCTLLALLIGFNGSCLYLSFALLSNRGLQEGFNLGLARLQDCWFLGWQELNCALSLHCWLDSMDRACICLLSYFSSRSTRRFQSRIGKAAGLLVSGLTRAKLCTLLALSCICLLLCSPIEACKKASN